MYRDGSVAQWIEQLRPKEKVVRSTRTRVTKFELKAALTAFFLPRSVYNRTSVRENTIRVAFILEFCCSQ